MYPPPYSFRDPPEPSPAEQWAKLEGKSPTMATDLLRAVERASLSKRSAWFGKIAAVLRFAGRRGRRGRCTDEQRPLNGTPQ